MQAELWTISGLAVELARDRRALAKALEGLRADEESTDAAGRVTRRYRMARVIAHLYADHAEEFDDQRQRLAAAQAEKVEHENAVRRGLLADVTAVERTWADFVTNCRTRLLGMGSKLGPQLVNLADAAIIATAIRTEARAALAELAAYEPPGNGIDCGDEEGGAPDGAPAGPDGQSVGRRRKTAVERVERGAGAVED